MKISTNERNLSELFKKIAEKPEREEMYNDILAEIKAQNSVERLEGEEFKLVPGTSRFYASNLGRILKLTTKGESLVRKKLSKNKTGRFYNEVLIELTSGEKFTCRLSRVIARTWLDSTLPFLYDKNTKIVVDHIDNNSQNDKLDNIRICTYSQNIKAAIYEQNRPVGKPIKKCYALNIYTMQVKEYDSTSKLVEDFWDKHNNGYFNVAAKNYYLVQNEWLVGYDKSELQDAAFIKRIKKAKTDEDKLYISRIFEVTDEI